MTGNSVRLNRMAVVNHRYRFIVFNRNQFLFLLSLLTIFNISYAEVNYSPYVGKNYPLGLYWGDTHLHTNLSVDANALGDLSVGPEEAYRFARGEEITVNSDRRVKLRRPLDFLVIADHSEYMGLPRNLHAGDPSLAKDETASRWLSLYRKGGKDLWDAVHEIMESSFLVNKRVFNNPTFDTKIWNEVIGAAERHYHPHRFTTLIGFEWSSMPEADNLHRVVIFKDGKDKVGQVLPFTAFDSQDPEKLWAYMDAYVKKTDGSVLAIPHNGNASNGLMFSPFRFDGEPLTRGYAETRQRWEPIFEVTQMKGDSETHSFLSPDDPFADYETWDRGNLLNTKVKEKGMLQYEYARSALKLGLKHQSNLGVNPYKFGMIGSTDAHTGLATADENNYWGKANFFHPNPDRWKHQFLKKMMSWELSASGYCAVWATENTRDAIYEAMQRKEVYATTGPRISVRFFGGWDYKREDAFKRDIPLIGYQKGVPMGGSLSSAPEGKSPSFLMRAKKDLDGANLDRIQVIKGWLSKSGATHEKIYDVALSDGREIGPEGKTPPVGNTVNVADASFTNTIGDPELAVVWTDPDFDKDELAFYYVRVLEIPTPRWTAYDARFFNVQMSDNVPMVIQERAYTSPIWYSPSAHRGSR